MERQEIRLPIKASLSQDPKVDPEVRRELLLQEAARARDEAREAQGNGDYDGASRRLNEVSAKLAAFGPADTQVMEEAEDLKHMAERFQRHQVTGADTKYLYQRSYAVATSRAAGVQPILRVTGSGSVRKGAPSCSGTVGAPPDRKRQRRSATLRGVDA